MAELRLVAARGEQRRPAVDAIAIGRRYRLAEGLAPEQARRICADPDLAIGAYRLTGERAEIMAAEPERLFVWDADVDPAALHGVLTAVDAQTGQPPALSPPVANRLTLTAARLAGPELQATGAGQLAQQHYETFLERLAAFPVKVEMLSRFRTAAEQNNILAGLAAGETT